MAQDQVSLILGQLLPGPRHLDQLIWLLTLHIVRQHATFLGVPPILCCFLHGDPTASSETDFEAAETGAALAPSETELPPRDR